jgi:DNA repair exonuclease SbcCD nuclease subunit
MENKKLIRFVFLADTHLGFDFPIRPRIDRRRRGEDFFNNFYRVLKYARDNNVDFVVHGGDLFFRSKVPRLIIDKAYQALFEFVESGIKFFIVPGNHERSILPTSLFISVPNLYIFDKPKGFLIEISGIPIFIAGFPFIRNNVKDRFVSLLKEIKLENNAAQIRLLCMHQTVEGASVGPKNYTFRKGNDVVRMGDIPGDYHAVLSGHIHRRQILVKHSNDRTSVIPIIYPGSIERTSFAEKAEEKGFYQVEFYGNNQNCWKIGGLNFIKVPTRPMVDIYLDSNINKQNLGDSIRELIIYINSNAIILLRISDKIAAHVKHELSGEYMRKLLPKTMNYQFTSGTLNNIKINM